MALRLVDTRTRDLPLSRSRSHMIETFTVDSLIFWSVDKFLGFWNQIISFSVAAGMQMSLCNQCAFFIGLIVAPLEPKAVAAHDWGV